MTPDKGFLSRSHVPGESSLKKLPVKGGLCYGRQARS
jgi:hypothetical protein